MTAQKQSAVSVPQNSNTQTQEHKKPLVTTENGVIKPLSKRKIDFSKLPPLRSAEDIAKMDIPPLTHIVDGIITEGVGLLAAREKMGKSWFCYQLGQCVADGAPFLGHKTTQGDVLYIDLENERAVRKNRILTMFPDGEPSRLKFVNPNDKEEDEQTTEETSDEDEEPILIGSGFEQVICHYLDEMDNPKLVIIDVIDIVADDQRKNEAPKKHAYRNISKLKRIARKRHIAIICIMHFRKMSDPDDFMSNISGSNGWAAAADFSMGITRKRGEPDAVFQTDGRTCKGVEISIVQDEKTMKWRAQGTLEQIMERKKIEGFKENDITKAIVAAVKTGNGKWCGTSDMLIGQTVFEENENGEGQPIIQVSPRAVTSFISGSIDLFKKVYGIKILDRNCNNSKTAEWVISMNM